MIAQNKYKISGLGLLVALVVLGALLVVAKPGGATAGPVVQAAQISSVPAAQTAALPALREPAELAVPTYVRRASTARQAQRFGLNPALARAVVPPGGDVSKPWHVVPGASGVCLFGDDGGTCQSVANASVGTLSVQLIPPYDNSRVSPLPPPGAPIKSTIIGVAPDGVTSVSAITSDGRKVTGVVEGGMFKIAGTDLGTLSFGRSGALTLTAMAPVR